MRVSESATEAQVLLPPCLTVTEVMAIYRLSRCTVYAQAASYLERGPGFGIPVCQADVRHLR